MVQQFWAVKSMLSAAIVEIGLVFIGASFRGVGVKVLNGVMGLRFTLTGCVSYYVTCFLRRFLVVGFVGLPMFELREVLSELGFFEL